MRPSAIRRVTRVARVVPRPRSARERVLLLLIVGVVGEIAWTIYLGWRLPRIYVAEHWDAAWVGLDAGEIFLFLACAWAAWRRRAVVVLFATAAATLLVVDAWFDVTTARHGDLLQSLLTTGLVEIPAALGLLVVAYRVARRVLRGYGERRGLLQVTVPANDGELVTHNFYE